MRLDVRRGLALEWIGVSTDSVLLGSCGRVREAFSDSLVRWLLPAKVPIPLVAGLPLGTRQGAIAVAVADFSGGGENYLWATLGFP